MDTTDPNKKPSSAMSKLKTQLFNNKKDGGEGATASQNNAGEESREDILAQLHSADDESSSSDGNSPDTFAEELIKARQQKSKTEGVEEQQPGKASS